MKFAEFEDFHDFTKEKSLNKGIDLKGYSLREESIKNKPNKPKRKTLKTFFKQNKNDSEKKEDKKGNDYTESLKWFYV